MYRQSEGAPNAYLNNCIITIINHLPFVPHSFLADTSSSVSVYSTTVNQILIFESNWGILRCWRLLLYISRSLQSTIKLGME